MKLIIFRVERSEPTGEHRRNACSLGKVVLTTGMFTCTATNARFATHAPARSAGEQIGRKFRSRLRDFNLHSVSPHTHVPDLLSKSWAVPGSSRRSFGRTNLYNGDQFTAWKSSVTYQMGEDSR